MIIRRGVMWFGRYMVILIMAVGWMGNCPVGDARVIYHIVMYGQSLMLGTQSVPLISEHQRYNSLMFKGGLRAGFDADSDFYGAFVPLKEKVSISPHYKAKLGETPASGFSETFLHLLEQENGWIYDTKKSRVEGWDGQLLISIPAQGTTSARTLTDEGPYWARFKNDITAGARLAAEHGHSYKVPFVIWNQGEHDIDLKTNPEDYKRQLVAFQEKADRFIRSVTKQKDTVQVILYQTSSHNVRRAMHDPSIANAQYELAQSAAHITMSNATYELPYAKDHVHFSNIGSKLNGAMHAVAAKRMLVDGASWRSIYVMGSSVKKNVITLRFHVPVPPLVFDELAVSNPGSYGFRVFDRKGRELALKNVVLRETDEVVLTVKGRVRKGDYVWYGNTGTGTGAMEGARGNLRDSQGNELTIAIFGKTYRLDNWCPILKKAL